MDEVCFPSVLLLLLLLLKALERRALRVLLVRGSGGCCLAFRLPRLVGGVAMAALEADEDEEDVEEDDEDVVAIREGVVAVPKPLEEEEVGGGGGVGILSKLSDISISFNAALADTCCGNVEDGLFWRWRMFIKEAGVTGSREPGWRKTLPSEWGA